MFQPQSAIANTKEKVNYCFHPSRSIDGLWNHWQRFIDSFPINLDLRISIIQPKLPESDAQPRPKPEAIDIKTIDSLRSALQNDPRTNETNYFPIRFYVLGGGFGLRHARGLSPAAIRLAFGQLDLPPTVLRMIYPIDGKGSSAASHRFAGSLAQRVSRRLIYNDDGSLMQFYMWYQIPYVNIVPNEEMASQLSEMKSCDLMEMDPIRKGSAFDETASTCMAYNNTSQTSDIVSIPDSLTEPLKVARGLLEACEPATLSEDPFCIVLAQLGLAQSSWTIEQNDLTSHRLMLNNAMDTYNRIDDADDLRRNIADRSTRRVKLRFLDETVCDLKKMHTLFYVSSGRSTKPNSRMYHDIQEEFENYIAFFSGLGISYEAELKTLECFLEVCHHQNAERDSQRLTVNSDLMKEMTEQSREEGKQLAIIAQETKRDSFAMKTIAIVTMIYLPGAFVSSIFGMQLIQVQDGHLKIVKESPYFAALTIALTLGTLVVWFTWIRRKDRNEFSRSVSSMGEMDRESSIPLNELV